MNNRTVHAIRHIVSSPDKNGGQPFIAGRGVSVDIIAGLHKSGLDVSQIADEYDLTPGQVHAALSYYYDHRDEIERLIGQQKAAYQAILDTEYISVAEAASRLDKSEDWVRKLCRSGRLRCARLGRDWLIEPESLDLVNDLKVGYPKGRPRKQDAVSGT